MRDGIPESLDRLPGEGAPGAVGDRAGNHDRHLAPHLLEDLGDREERGLRVQRIEDRLDEQHIDAALQQRAHLLGVGDAQLLEGDGAKRGIVHVARNGGGDRHRPDGARDETAGAGGRADRIRGVPREAGGLEIHLASEALEERILDDLLKVRLILARALDAPFEKEIVLADGGRAKGVRLDDVGARFEVLAVDFLDHLRLGQEQQLVIPAQVFPLPIAEARAAEFSLVERVFPRGAKKLHHRPHGAVDDHDAFAEKLGERMGSGDGHAGDLINSGCATVARNKLTHHDGTMGMNRANSDAPALEG